jgi:hypothetical protein
MLTSSMWIIVRAISTSTLRWQMDFESADAGNDSQ